jgi:hypothetical protein
MSGADWPPADAIAITLHIGKDARRLLLESSTARLDGALPIETANSSRVHPARGCRKLPPAPGNPRKPTGERPCSRGKSPRIPA